MQTLKTRLKKIAAAYVGCLKDIFSGKINLLL